MSVQEGFLSGLSGQDVDGDRPERNGELAHGQKRLEAVAGAEGRVKCVNCG